MDLREFASVGPAFKKMDPTVGLIVDSNGKAVSSHFIDTFDQECVRFLYRKTVDFIQANPGGVLAKCLYARARYFRDRDEYFDLHDIHGRVCGVSIARKRTWWETHNGIDNILDPRLAAAYREGAGEQERLCSEGNALLIVLDCSSK